ncbi:MAG: PHP domain-containing protein [Chloroflexi bacterium]|nr:PHP domain-containing protein [Chloroflexota bacterium]
MSKADLHVHSTASDGHCSPAEIIRKAVEVGLTIIAISDHDTVEGIPDALSAAREFPQLRVIPAVEISTDIPNGEAHVLGYFIDYTNQNLKASLEQMRNSRLERAHKMVEKLRVMGFDIEWRRVREIAGSSTLGRPHIAQALLEKGYIESLKEAFSKYIGHGGPAYVEREKLTPVEAVQLVLKANGLPVLAHPLTVPDPESTVKELKAFGMVGIEVYYADYPFEKVSSLLNLANKYNLIPTGGSDYHGIDDVTETMIGDINVPIRFVEELFAMAKQSGLQNS